MRRKFSGSASGRGSRAAANRASTTCRGLRSALGAILLILGLSFAANPVQAIEKIQPVTVAVIDAQAVLRQCAAAKSIRDQLEKQREVYQKLFQERENKLRDEEKSLAQQRTILAPDAFQKKVREHQENVTALQRDGQGLKRQLDQAFNDAMGQVREELIKIVADLAKETGVGLVLFKNQIFLGERKLDISDEALARLNKKLPTVKVNIPKAPS